MDNAKNKNVFLCLVPELYLKICWRTSDEYTRQTVPFRKYIFQLRLLSTCIVYLCIMNVALSIGTGLSVWCHMVLKLCRNKLCMYNINKMITDCINFIILYIIVLNRKHE